MENELYHHGVKGQKWGVRRYQNPDGSLTLAGKQRALKMQNRYTELTKNKKYRDNDGNLTYAGKKKAVKMKEEYSQLTGKTLRKFSSKSGSSNKANTTQVVTNKKPKSISEMTNQEIQAKIDRIRLENTLKSLTPEQVSTGQKFVNGIKSAGISIAKDKGTKIVGDLVEKKLRETLRLTNQQTRSASDILREQAQDAQNRYNLERNRQRLRDLRRQQATERNDRDDDDNDNDNDSSNNDDEERRRNRS